MPYTLPGETVDADRVPGHPDRRHLLRVIEPSPDRIEPFCPHFGICGGCATQHWARAPYRAWKRGLVVSALEAAGIETEIDELIDAHGEGRRRAVLHARQGTKEIVEVGFSALARACDRPDRSLSGAGALDEGRDRDRLEDRGGACRRSASRSTFTRPER